ncbi:ImmA/IrrE family metallo-endopeptidase [Aminobacter aminovorans]|uniref:ImmA/IrrE family metallo-endopeptidase n=1 Tax=Aminobacter aminovorans TaxID=83263 RepID=UPI002865E565|nr:ImmA/IrrE family metallo-endopeptidase [Aminobacter aminovorans]MDR7220932.1 Zn-dependent peptidase ImmA (M78 family) [Aminobacter aminovorans]
MAKPSELIEQYTSDAPVNIEGLIEAFGVRLERKAELSPQIAGQIERTEDGKFEISVNKEDHYYRRRFTMAHELAHYLLHRSLIGAGVDDTKAYRSLDIGKFHNRSITQEHETEANRVAAKLLMPAKLVARCYGETGGDIAQMAKVFKVSAEAMGYRVQSLGLS